MERADRLRRLLTGLAQRARARKVPNHRPRISEPARRIGRGLLLIATAAWLGGLAEGGARARALNEFERSHLPDRTVWTALLERLLAAATADPSRQHAVLRTLPAQLDQPGAAWWNPVHGWIAVFPRDPEESPWVFVRKMPPGTRRDPPRAEQWRPMGVGWTALQRVTTELASRHEVPPTARAKKRISPDPRELRY